MVRESEQHAAEDRKARERADTKNQAEHLVYTVEKTLREQGEKVPEDRKRDITNAVEKVKSALGSDDVERIKSAMEELQQASFKLSEILYQQAAASGQQAAGEQQAGSGGKGGGGDVIDAEFKAEG
jgi:molecular chaperone DnaK